MILTASIYFWIGDIEMDCPWKWKIERSSKSKWCCISISILMRTQYTKEKNLLNFNKTIFSFKWKAKFLIYSNCGWIEWNLTILWRNIIFDHNYAWFTWKRMHPFEKKLSKRLTFMNFFCDLLKIGRIFHFLCMTHMSV